MISQEGFAVLKRSKRPLLDAINALISFCNVILYHQFFKKIWKLQLDPKIEVIYASNQRP